MGGLVLWAQVCEKLYVIRFSLSFTVFFYRPCKYRKAEEKAKLCLWVDDRIPEAVRWLEECCRLMNRLSEEHPFLLAPQHELAGAYQAGR